MGPASACEMCSRAVKVLRHYVTVTDVSEELVKKPPILTSTAQPLHGNSSQSSMGEVGSLSCVCLWVTERQPLIRPRFLLQCTPSTIESKTHAAPLSVQHSTSAEFQCVLFTFIEIFTFALAYS